MDSAFIKLYTDFAEARNNERPNVATLGNTVTPKILPNETFHQKTNSATDIVFVGGIRVDLVKCDGSVVRDVTNNFFYEGITDENGIKQIDFEFGMFTTDYWTEVLYLKITDLLNNNVWYSNGFYCTYYGQYKTTQITYYNQSDINGIAYSLFQYKQQRIRFSDCYVNDIDDTMELKEYTKTDGNKVNYRGIATPITEYIFERCDAFTYRRLLLMRGSGFIYIDGYRATITDIKKEARQGDANWFQVTILANVQSEFLPYTFQLFEGLRLVSLLPAHNSITSDDVTQLRGEFNRNVTLGTGIITIYLDDVLIFTYNQTDITITDNNFYLPLTTDLTTNGVYNVVISDGLFISDIGVFEGLTFGNWTFTKENAEFDDTEFNNEFLI
jgi:hypothetical protein